MQKNKKILLVLASVVLAGALVGCNVDNSSSSETPSSSESSSSSSSSEHAHSYGDWTLTTEPTTTTTGVATRTCVDSDDTETTIVPVLTDTSVWSVKSSTADSCEAAGKTVYTSTLYGDVTVNGKAKGHAYGPLTVTKEPTLTEKGSAKQVCANDANHVITEDVPALSDNNTWSVKSEKAPTCTEAGNVVYTSTKYGDVTITVSAKDHAYGEWSIVTAPTATTVGSAKQVCANDNEHVETKELPVLTDTSVWTAATTPAKCGVAGKTVYTSIYGEVTVEIPALEHDYSAWKITTAPTISEDGVITRVCSHDSTHVETKTIKNLNDASFWSVDTGVMPVMPTLTTPGSARLSCEWVSIDVEMPVLTDTSFWKKETLSTPGCTSIGQDKYSCNYPGAVVIIDTEATGHLDVTHVEGVEPTCEETGVVEHWICNDCGNIYSDEALTNQITLADTIIPATDHAYGDWALDIEPTATEGGLASRVCSNDSSHIEEKEVPAITDTSVWEVVSSTNPTYDAKGSITVNSIYGTVTIEVPELEDSSVWTISERVEPTCDEDGHITFTSAIYGEITCKLAAFEHDYGEWSFEVEPTEDAAGKAIKVCSNGDHPIEIDVPALTDTSVWELINEKPAYDINPGQRTYASEYGEITVVVPALYGPWTLPEGDIELGSTITLTKTSSDGENTKTASVTVPSEFIAKQNVLLGENDAYKLENTGGYDFNYDESTNTFTSSNAGINNSKSILSFTPKSDGVLTFDVYCSSESDSKWDYFSCAAGSCGGTSANQNKSFTMNVTAGTTYTLTYQKDGSSQSGEDKAVISNLVFEAPISNVELTIVEFVSDGEAVNPIIVGKGFNTNLPDAYKEGYKLAGWYDVTLTNKYDSNSIIEGYTFMYPKWEDGYTVTAHVTDSIVEKYVQFDGSEVELTKPVNPGYKFVGWYTTSTFDEGSEWNPSANTTTSIDVYAKWEEAPVYSGSYAGREVWYQSSKGSSLQTITIDEEGNISGSETGVVISYDTTSGLITWGATLDATSTKCMWYKDGILCIPDSSSATVLSDDVNVYVKGAEDLTITNSSFIDGNSKYSIKLISLTIGSEEPIGILLEGTNIHTNVTISSLNNDVTFENAYNHSDVVIKDSNGNVLLSKGYNGSSMVDLDSTYGIYTNGEEQFISYGTGKFTYGDKEGIYEVNSDTNVLEAYVIENEVDSEYLEITLSDSTFAVVKPMVEVTYVISEGNNSVISTNKNIAIVVPDDPTLENHRFDGWYTDSTYTTPFDFDAGVSGATSIYAKWVRQYSVTIYGDSNAESLVSEVVDVNTEYTPVLPSSYINGKTIDGYYHESAYETEWTVGSPITSDLVLYVKVTDLFGQFIPSGVVSEIVSTTDTTSKQYAWDIVPADGMATLTSANDGLGGSKSYLKLTLAKESIISFNYSVGSEQNYDKLIVTVNGTQKLNVSGADKTGTFNEKLTAGDVVEIYYSKDGSGDKNGDSATITEFKLSDGYPSSTITIVYNDGVTENGSATVDYLSTLTADHLQEPTNVRDAESYKFGGWYLDESFEIEATTDTIVNVESLTLYARWLEKVTVSFVVPEGVTAIENITTWSHTAIEVEEPTLAGHVFRGWYLEDSFDTWVDLSNGVSENDTFYAKFEAVPVGSTLSTADVITITNGLYVKENASTTEEFDDYYFKLEVESADTYYFVVNNAKYVGGNGTHTNTNYARFRILDSTGATLSGTSNYYSLNDYYNSCAINLAPGTYYVHVNLALNSILGSQPNAIVYGTFNMNVATSANDTADTAIELTVDGETLTSSQLERTYAVYKFAVEAGKTYNVTVSKSADIYSDAGFTTKLASTPWAGGTKSVEATEDGTYYIRTMYSGVSFSVASIELDILGNKVFDAEYSCDCYPNSTCTTKFTFDGAGAVAVNVSCVDSDGYGNYHGGTTNGTYTIEGTTVTVVAGSDTFVLELDSAETPTKLTCTSTTMSSSADGYFPVGTEFSK